jgi:hypothetical protein
MTSVAELKPITKRSLRMMSPRTHDAIIKERREVILPTLPTHTSGVTAPVFVPVLTHEGSQGFMTFDCPMCLRTNSHGCEYPFIPHVHHRGGHCGCYPNGYFLRVDP